MHDISSFSFLSPAAAPASRRRGRLLADWTQDGLPGLQAGVADAPLTGARAWFRGPGARLSLAAELPSRVQGPLDLAAEGLVGGAAVATGEAPSSSASERALATTCSTRAGTTTAAALGLKRAAWRTLCDRFLYSGAREFCLGICRLCEINAAQHVLSVKRRLKYCG